MTNNKSLNTDPINILNKNIYSFSTIFILNSDIEISKFWDYFLDVHININEKMRMPISVIYAFAKLLFKANNPCQIIKETDSTAIYLTMTPLYFLNHQIIEKILYKYNPNLIYSVSNDKLTIKLDNIDIEPVALAELNDETKQILEKTHFNKLSAHEFIEKITISYMDKIELLVDIEDEITESLISFENEPNLNKTNLVSKAFINYAKVVKLFIDFEHLVFAIMSLANAIESITEMQMTSKEIKKFTTLTLYLVDDLGNWRENIFIKQEANDIHYLDSSLLSSCLQIETIFVDKKIEEEDDFELF